MNTERDILTWFEKEGGGSWLSALYFKEKLNRSKSTIAKALKTLCDKGIVERKKGWYPSDITVWSTKIHQYYYRLEEKEAE